MLETVLLYALPILAIALVVGTILGMCDRKHAWILVIAGLISHAAVAVLVVAVMRDIN